MYGRASAETDTFKVKDTLQYHTSAFPEPTAWYRAVVVVSSAVICFDCYAFVLSSQFVYLGY